jgi:peroxiredoxin
MMRRRLVLAAIVVGSMLLPLGVTGEVSAKRSHAPATGLRTVAFAKAPPDFTFDDGAGPTHLAALTGKPVILSFWATWCEPCRAELPAFGHLREAYGDAVTLLTISDEPAGAARAFLQSRHLDLPVVEDPARKIFEAYSVTPIPVSIGETSYDELQAAVAAALITPE